MIVSHSICGVKSQSETTTEAAGNKINARAPRLSTDRKWKSFAKVPHLLQYKPTEQYYARVKVSGKLVRRKLGTNVYSKALLLLGDFLKEQRSKAPRSADAPVTFMDARTLFERRLELQHVLKERTKIYRLGCIKALLKTWPGLDALKLNKITVDGCLKWANRFSEVGYDEHYFNQTLSTLRHILDDAGLSPNPAMKVGRLGVQLRQREVPERDEFLKLLANMEQGGGRDSRNCADLVRFLAYSGCRLSEAKAVTWGDVDLKAGTIRVLTAKRRKSQDKVKFRLVPINPDMRNLLDRLASQNPSPEKRVCNVHECQKALTRACAELELQRITHHDLRHLFATRCIESGVDIPTVSRWLGHSDGGALAMRVYGHLCDQHSQQMASKVHF